jgi:capsular exopolysaccharide synthesis family protein
MEQQLTLPGQSASLSRIHETSAKFQRYRILLRRRWWFLLLTASLGLCFQALRITGKPIEYKSVAKLVAGGRVVDQSAQAVWQEQLQDFYGTIIETLEGGSLKNKALTRMRTVYPDMKESEVEIRVLQNKGSAIFNVMATGREGDYTQKFLNSLIDEFISQRAQVREQALGKVLTSFADGVFRREKQYQEAAEKLESFRKANDIISLTSGHNVAAATLTRLNAERDQLRNQLVEMDLALKDVGAAMQKRERGITSGGSGNAQGSGQAQPESGGNPGDMSRTNSNSSGMTRTEQEWVTTKHELLSLRVEKGRLLEQFKPQYPGVVDITEKIAKAEALLRLLEDEILSELKQAKADGERQIQAKETSIAEKKIEAMTLASLIAQDQKLSSDMEAKRQAFEAWFERASELNQITANITDYVAIQDAASTAVQDDDEWAVPLLVGLVLGIGAGAVILLLFDRLDDRMNSFSEFAALFPNEAVLGQVPEQRQSGDVALLRPNDDRHLYAEAFRNIRSSILFKNWQGKPPKTLLITSAVPNEGKTTVTSNLAITMALSGARVLLADCDLRRGGINELFKLPVSPGMSDALRGTLQWRDVVQESGTRNLDVMARGDVLDQTSEMLLSKNAQEMLKQMAEEYDYVIFDSAPVLVADDTASFAPKLDAVLFVVRLSSTMARLSGKALDLLYDRQVNVGGVILNRSSSNLKEYTYYNYASYYYTPKASPAPPAAKI